MCIGVGVEMGVVEETFTASLLTSGLVYLLRKSAAYKVCVTGQSAEGASIWVVQYD